MRGGMLVEAAWVASKAPGPLHAFYERIRARRGFQIAVVATARKLAVVCWHLIPHRQATTPSPGRRSPPRSNGRSSCAPASPSRRGQKGTAATYSLKDVRRRERAVLEHRRDRLQPHPSSPAGNNKRPRNRPGVDTFIRGVHDGAQLDREVKERHELGPRPLPGVDHRPVTLGPSVGELGRSGPRRPRRSGRCRSPASPDTPAPQCFLRRVTQARAQLTLLRDGVKMSLSGGPF